MPRLTPLHFYQYLKCPSWVWLDVYGDSEKRKRLHPLTVTLWKQGLLGARNFIREHDFVTIESEDLDEASVETIALMRKGAQTIYRGVLLHGNWVARPDLLARVEGRSRFGNYYYVACDIKNTRELEDVHKLQGAFYAHLLNELQGVQPVVGYVLTPAGRTLTFIIEEALDRYQVALREIEEILNGKRPDPVLRTSCQESPWKQECVGEAERCQDLSLITSFNVSEYRKLKALGIGTVSELVARPIESLAKELPEVSRARLVRLHRQAEALVTKKPIVLESVVLPKAERELYIDFEIDPLRDVAYFFGLLLHERSGDRYYPFFVERPEDESRVWKKLIDFLASFPGAPRYHYGHNEILILRRLAEHYGSVLETFGTMIDLAEVVNRAVVFPVYFYSLKDITTILGHGWKNPEASETGSMFWYHKWIETEKRQVREQILNYHEDELRATLLLKNWLVNQRA